MQPKSENLDAALKHFSEAFAALVQAIEEVEEDERQDVIELARLVTKSQSIVMKLFAANRQTKGSAASQSFQQ